MRISQTRSIGVVRKFTTGEGFYFLFLEFMLDFYASWLIKIYTYIGCGSYVNRHCCKLIMSVFFIVTLKSSTLMWITEHDLEHERLKWCTFASISTWAAVDWMSKDERNIEVGNSWWDTIAIRNKVFFWTRHYLEFWLEI